MFTCRNNKMTDAMERKVFGIFGHRGYDFVREFYLSIFRQKGNFSKLFTFKINQ
jgi:hypothetical protein